MKKKRRRRVCVCRLCRASLMSRPFAREETRARAHVTGRFYSPTTTTEKHECKFVQELGNVVNRLGLRDDVFARSLITYTRISLLFPPRVHFGFFFTAAERDARCALYTKTCAATRATRLSGSEKESSEFKFQIGRARCSSRHCDTTRRRVM